MKINNIKWNGLLKRSFIYIISDLVTKAMPFFIIGFLTKFLAKAEYGIISNFQTYVYILLPIIAGNSQSAILVNYKTLNSSDRKDYYSNTYLILLICIPIILIINLFFSSELEKNLGIPTWAIHISTLVALCEFISLTLTYTWLIESDSYYLVYYNLSKAILELLLTVCLVLYMPNALLARFIAIVFTSFSFAIICIYILKKRNFLFEYSLNFLRKILTYSLPLILHELSHLLKTGFDRFLLTMILGLSFSGLYALGFQIASILLTIGSSMNNAFVPFLFEKLNHERDVDKREIVKISYYYLLIIIFIFSISQIFFTLLYDFFINPKFYQSLLITRFLSLALLFRCLYFIFVNYIIYLQKSKLLSSITLSVSLFHSILSYTLIKKIGIMGVCYALIFSEFINLLIIIIISNKVYPMPWLSFITKFEFTQKKAKN